MTTVDFLKSKLNEATSLKRVYTSKEELEFWEESQLQSIDNEIEHYIDAIATINVFNKKIEK